MCGRFVIKTSWEELEDWYDIINQGLPAFPTSYNITPTQPVPIIACLNERDKLKRELTFARWGLIPFWWKKPWNELPRSFNARCEGIENKPFFRSAYKYRRCLIPVRGFYEWKGKCSPKQPYYISQVDGRLMTFAGVYEEWVDAASGSEVLSVSIITTAANRFMREIHTRMPVILDRQNFSEWLHGRYETLMTPCPDRELQAWPVTTKMNSSLYNEEGCIEPLVEDGKLL